MSLQKFPSFFLDFSERDMKGENGHSYGFGRFTLDLAEQRLLNGEIQIPLTPKSFEILSLLVQNAGHLVEKEELMQHVWPDSFVEESNVARIVHTLRKRLGDDGNGNIFIETVPTKGYRFVADVEVIGEPSDEDPGKNASAENTLIESATDQPIATVPTETPTATSHRRHYLLVVAIVLLGAFVTGFWISNGSLMPRPLERFVRHSQNGEAYREFQQGKLLLEQKHSRQTAEEALKHFEKAIEIDPEYAEAYAGKADVKTSSVIGERTNDDNATAQAAVKKALELDPNSSFAHTVNCRIMGTYDWAFEEAVAECRHAVALDPNDARAHRELGLALNVLGQSDEALSELDTAIAISPTSEHKRCRGIILYYAQRYDEAVEQFQQLVATDPEFTDAYKWLMLVYAMKNDQAKAFENLLIFDQSLGATADDISAARSAFATGGWPDAVRAALNAPTGLGTQTRFVVADLLAQIGEKDKAFDVLEEMRKRRALMMVDVKRDSMMDSIRDDPRYLAITSEMRPK